MTICSIQFQQIQKQCLKYTRDSSSVLTPTMYVFAFPNCHRLPKYPHQKTLNPNHLVSHPNPHHYHHLSQDTLWD